MLAGKTVTGNYCSFVDVREPEEFENGNVGGSVNIPLHEMQHRIEELKKLKQPLVLCCASGNRSEQAQSYLTQQGNECYNGGSWIDVNYYHAQKI